MKFLERFTLRLFSIMIIVVSIILVLIATGLVKPTIVPDLLEYLTQENIKKTTIVISIVLCLLGLKSLFARLKPVDEAKNGVVLQNASGRLVISKESLENLISEVSKDIYGAESVSSKTVLDTDRNLIVYVSTVVNGDVKIKDISTEIQSRIKEAIKSTADLDVKEVNIKIKNIVTKKGKMPKEVKEEPRKVNTNIFDISDEDEANKISDGINEVIDNRQE